jgi:hypothetical protein
VRGLLDDEGVQAGGVRGQCRRHAATAGADDEHIHAGVERFRTHRSAPVGTAVRTANPAINSGAAR